MPNSPRTVTLYTEVASAAVPPTRDADTAIRAAQAAMEAVNDQKCSQPRIRGLTRGARAVSVGSGAATFPMVTFRGYGSLFDADVSWT